MSIPIAILNTGLVTSVGLSAPAACAAIRAGLSNPSTTRFFDPDGKWIKAHQVPLAQPWCGLVRLAKMASMAIAESLANVPKEEWPEIPLLLCVAEQERPGRLAGLDDALAAEVHREIGSGFSSQSLVIPHGRVSAGVALIQARRIIEERRARRVLVVATDSLLSGSTLKVYGAERKLLSEHNSNGFMPGEAAGALLLGPDTGGQQVLCKGLAFATEAASIDSGQPLRGDGLVHAISGALKDAGRELHDIDFRVTDLSGEQYYFKEATLALTRILRVRKEEFDIWHPAQSIGETGAAAGVATFVVASAACHKRYARGPNILCHAANDGGQRAAAVVHFRAA